MKIAVNGRVNLLTGPVTLFSQHKDYKNQGIYIEIDGERFYLKRAVTDQANQTLQHMAEAIAGICKSERNEEPSSPEQPDQRTPDQFTYTVGQSIISEATKQAVKMIQRYGAQKGLPDLEDVADPDDPVMSLDETYRIMPEIKEAMSNAIEHPDYKPTFSLSKGMYEVGRTAIASGQARKDLGQQRWTTIVQAAAEAILIETGHAELTEAIKAFIKEEKPKP